MLHIIIYIAIHCNGIIYHTEVYEEMFDANSKKAQTMQNILKFIVGKLNLQLNGKLQ